MSLSRIYNPQLGRHLVAATVKPLTVAENGAVTVGSAVNVLARLTGLDSSLETSVENISPINSLKANPVPIEDSGSLTVEFFKVNDGTDPEPIRALFLTNRYFLVEWTEGTGVSAKQHAFYGLMTSNSGNHRGKGQQIASFTLQMADFGASSYTRA